MVVDLDGIQRESLASYFQEVGQPNWSGEPKTNWSIDPKFTGPRWSVEINVIYSGLIVLSFREYSRLEFYLLKSNLYSNFVLLKGYWMQRKTHSSSSQFSVLLFFDILTLYKILWASESSLFSSGEALHPFKFLANQDSRFDRLCLFPAWF